MKHTLIKALAISSVAGLGLFSANEAHAIVFGSSLAFSGASTPTLNENKAKPTSFNVDQATLSFADTTKYIFVPETLTFTADGSNYLLDEFTFKVEDGSAVGTEITFSGGEYIKQGANGTTFFSPITGFSGNDNKIKYSGTIFFSQSGIGDNLSASYSGSFTAVLEPLTMLGAAAAVGFGVAFKRNSAKKPSSEKI